MSRLRTILKLIFGWAFGNWLWTAISGSTGLAAAAVFVAWASDVPSPWVYFLGAGVVLLVASAFFHTARAAVGAVRRRMSGVRVEIQSPVRIRRISRSTTYGRGGYLPERPYDNILSEKTIYVATGEVVPGTERNYADNEVIAVYVVQTAPTGWTQIEMHYRTGEPRLEWVPTAGIPADAVPRTNPSGQ